LERQQIYHPSLPALYLNVNHYTVLQNAKRLRGEEKRTSCIKALIDIAQQLAMEGLKM
jgi:hypothetical protein